MSMPVWAMPRHLLASRSLRAMPMEVPWVERNPAVRMLQTISPIMTIRSAIPRGLRGIRKNRPRTSDWACIFMCDLLAPWRARALPGCGLIGKRHSQDELPGHGSVIERHGQVDVLGGGGGG